MHGSCLPADSESMGLLFNLCSVRRTGHSVPLQWCDALARHGLVVWLVQCAQDRVHCGVTVYMHAVREYATACVQLHFSSMPSASGVLVLHAGGACV